MNQSIIIGKPNTRINGERAELFTTVQLPSGDIREIWYRVDKKWGDFVVETVDAFLVNIIYYAMFYGYDIQCEAPVSEKLYYQLKNHYLPVICKSKPFFHEIDIRANTVVPTYKSKKWAATGISCGVDSYYTMMKHMDTGLDAYNIKVAFFQDWFSIGFEEEKKKQWRLHFKELTSSVAKTLKIECIYVSCNIDEVLPTPTFDDPYYGFVCDKGFYTYKYCSIAFAMGKLVDKYYFSSGYAIDQFDLKPRGKVFDEDHYSLFNVSSLSSECVEVFHYGGEATRIEKLEYLSNFPIVKKTLSVCGDQKNCGHCPKCIRTMGELYSINKLDSFGQSFPIEDFKKHLARNFAVIIMNSSNDFFAEILNKCKENHVKIPMMSYLLVPICYVCEKARLRLRNVKWARRIYNAIQKKDA